MGTAEKRALGNLPDKLLTDCALGNKLLPETKERWRLAGWGTLPQQGPQPITVLFLPWIMSVPLPSGVP